MDAVFELGTRKVFSEVAFQAAREFPLDMHHVHFDTTSVSGWGDYDARGPHTKQLNIAHCKNKDLRADLKQFLIKMVCVNRMATEDNLRTIGDNLFVTRLPFSYNEACRVISEAVAEGQWVEVGVLNATPATAKRPAARCRTTEKTVTLYDRQYRAVL